MNTCGTCLRPDCRCKERAILTEFVRWLVHEKHAKTYADHGVMRVGIYEVRIGSTEVDLNFLLEEFLK